MQLKLSVKVLWTSSLENVGPIFIRGHRHLMGLRPWAPAGVEDPEADAPPGAGALLVLTSI